MVHHNGHLIHKPYTRYVGGNVIMIDRCFRSNWRMNYLLKLCKDVGTRNVGLFYWFIPSSTTIKGNQHRLLSYETNFNEFILNVLVSKSRYIYVEHKIDVDKRLRDTLEPEPIVIEILTYESNLDKTQNEHNAM